MKQKQKREPFIRIEKNARGWRLVGLSGSALKLFLATLLSCAYKAGDASDGPDLVHVEPGQWLVHMTDAARTAGVRDWRTAQAGFDELADAGLVTVEDRGKTHRGHKAKHLISVINPGEWIHIDGPANPPAKNAPGPQTSNVYGFAPEMPHEVQTHRQPMHMDILAPVVQNQNQNQNHPSPTPSAVPEPEGMKEEVERLGTGLQEHRAAGAAEQQASRVAGEGWVSGIVPVDGPPRSETDFLQGLIDQAYGKNGRTGR